MEKILQFGRNPRSKVLVSFGVGILNFNSPTASLCLNKQDAIDLAKEILKEWS